MKYTQTHQYQIIIERGVDGYFVARVPSLPGCITQAKTYESVIERTKEAIQLCREVAGRDRGYRRRTLRGVSVPTFVGVANVAV